MTNTESLRPGWRVLKFKEIAESVTERVDDPAAAGVDRYVGLEHLDPESLHIRRWGSPADVGSTKLRFYPGDVVYARRRAYQRKLGVADFEGICSAHALVLRARPRACLPEFLPFFLQSDDFHERALNISVGSLSPTINWKTLAIQEFAIPPLEEQRRTVELLTAPELCASALLLCSERTSMLERAVADEVWGNASPGRRLDELVDITVGIVVRPADLYVAEGGIAALRSLNVAPNHLRDEDLVHISEEGHAQHKKSVLSGGEVVVVRSGRPGDAAVIPQDGLRRNAIDLLIIRCGPGIRPEYLSRYLNSAPGRRQLLGRSAGTAQQHLNAGQLKSVAVPVMGLSDQDELIEKFSAVDSVSENVQASQRTAKRLASELRERLMQGEPRVQ